MYQMVRREMRNRSAGGTVTPSPSKEDIPIPVSPNDPSTPSILATMAQKSIAAMTAAAPPNLLGLNKPISSLETSECDIAIAEADRYENKSMLI